MKKFFPISIFFLFTSIMLYSKPIDKNATCETKELFIRLESLIQQKKILLGQQDATAYGVTWKSEANQSDMKLVSGTHPALYGWELGGIENGAIKNLDAVDFNEMRKLIQEADERGGVNTISWHLNNPVNDLSAWDDKSKGSIDSIMPGAIYHQKYLGYLDKLSVFLGSLKTIEGKYIPIIFRPFHEHTGNWFWWGADQNSVKSYIQLWQFTINYLRDVKNLHHLLYAYSPDKTPIPENYFERYPGDDYVDVLGFDSYHFGDSNSAPDFIEKTHKMLLYISENAKKRGKPAAFTETGSETVKQNDWWTSVLYKTINKVPIAYVMVWRNAYDRPNHFYGPTPNHPANKDFMRLIDNKNIITGNKLTKK